MDKEKKMIAIEIMAGKPEKKGYKSEEVEPHMATCPKCGFEFEMGGEEDEYEDEED